jgi:hypothetical protein
MAKQPATHFLDNKRFREILLENKQYQDKEDLFNSSTKLTKEQKEHYISLLRNDPKWKNIQSEIGNFFLLLAKKRIMIKQYSGYSYDWKEDMISDALYTMWRYLKNFDPARNTSPFSYYTTTTDRAFNNYINLKRKDLERQVPLSYIENLARPETDEG